MRNSLFLWSGTMVLIVSSVLVAHTPPPLKIGQKAAIEELTQPITGEGPVVPVIANLQKQLAKQPDDQRTIHQLGRFLIAEARLSQNEALYQKSELCGQLLEKLNPKNPDALLLRGHSLLAMHQFHDAEHIGRKLLKQRQEMQDHALLGDALMEQGMLEESLPVYQAMIDAKPCLPSYSRVAHVRWLRGDIEGAIDMAEQAAACGSYRDPEPLAWVTTRLAFYQWQLGDMEAALQTARRAQELVPDYAHAQLVEGRVALAKKKYPAAIERLQKAAQRMPLPEVQWALADALQAAGRIEEARAVSADLEKHGAARDPRSFSIYLITRGVRKEEALTLAKNELTSRKDVHSWDALAWAQHASGAHAAALVSARKAQTEGTRDARLFLHSARIAHSAGQTDLAAHCMAEAQQLKHQLLPSELTLLDAAANATTALAE